MEYDYVKKSARKSTRTSSVLSDEDAGAVDLIPEQRKVQLAKLPTDEAFFVVKLQSAHPRIRDPLAHSIAPIT